MESQYVPEEGATWMPIGIQSLQIQAPGALRVFDHPRDGLCSTLDLELVGLSLEIRRVTVQGTREGEEVSSDDLRGVRLVELVQQNMPQYVTGTSITWSFPAAEGYAQSVKDAWPAPPAMASVVETYMFARAVRLPPIKAVTDSYRISRATAHRWMNMCRDAGYLIDG